MENALRGNTPDEALPLFSIIQGEALSLCAFMEAHRGEPYVAPGLAEAIDSAAFATRHEMRRVFERELARLADDTEADKRASVADAHEVLRNCFQQATALIANSLDSRVSDVKLFGDVQVRRERSVQLCEDLNALLRVMRHVEEDFSPQAVTLFVMRLQDFRLGSMRYLMQKDWAAIEAFLAQVPTLHSERKIKTFIHQFSGYLEVLLGHVRMRSVLSS
ncbi:MAG TPA: hypothetical protein VD968_00930 [Pyrinomonadaceae bacterium]|nr:hypothetical protein [Pyrinomonadaceae bacterium]